MRQNLDREGKPQKIDEKPRPDHGNDAVVNDARGEGHDAGEKTKLPAIAHFKILRQGQSASLAVPVGHEADNRRNEPDDSR